MSNLHQATSLVLFPLPFQGHINPMFQLANILHSIGFKITIIHTKFRFPNTSKHPHFTFRQIPDGLSEAEESSLTDISTLVHLLNANCAEPFRDCLLELMSDDDYYHCVIVDSVWYCTQAVADDLKLARILIRTTSVCSLLVTASLQQLRDQGYLSDRESKMEEQVHELPPLKVKDIPVFDTPSTEEFYKYTNIMVEGMKKASGLIFNTVRELEVSEVLKLGEQFHMPTFTIGPFNRCFSSVSSSLLSQDTSTIAWLDKQAPKSVLYVSFGSIATMDAHKLEEVAWGLANSSCRFLWVIRPGLIANVLDWDKVLPNGLLSSIKKQGYIVKWAPQQELLSHPSVGGFLTHSGWNSTLESICEGVPMICAPFLGDQMVNSRYVSDVWKIGIKLENGLERGEIENAIKNLMAGKQGEEMRREVMSLKVKLDGCFSSGGSSCQSLDDLVHFISSFRSSNS